MTDEFDRRWLALIAPLTWVEAFYALIGLTRLGDHPTTVERLAAARRGGDQAGLEGVAGPARRDGANPPGHPLAGCLAAPETPRQRPRAAGQRVRARPVHGGGRARRALPGRGHLPGHRRAAPDRLPPGSVERVDPPETVVAMLSPEQANTVAEMEIEQINMDL
jgi:hypothetical protein